MPGRNDPCPCGSGKKYKYCCMRQQEVTTTVHKNPHDGAIETVLNWLQSRHRKGWSNALERQRDELITPQDLETFQSFDKNTQSNIQINAAEWLLAEGSIEAQGQLRRINEYVLGPTGPQLNTAQRHWLLQFGQRPMRLYTVTDVIQGTQMTLCDTLDADIAPVVVRERSGTQRLLPGTILACRVMRVEDHFQLSGAIGAFSMMHSRVLIDQLRAAFKEFGSLPNFAQIQSKLILKAWLRQFFDPLPMPVMVDQYSGDPITLITDYYRVLDWSALSRALAGCVDVEGNRKEGWSRIIDCKDGQIRPLAHINLSSSPNHIEIFYKTQRYAQQGQAWFDALAGGSVTFLERKVVSPSNVKEKSRKPNPDNIDPREVTQAIQEAVMRHYANWADEPIPALNNKTPRQAIQTKAGLERVKGLLRSYEANDKDQATHQGRGTVSYDFLWESLNIAR
jgi:hypothetical protein